MAVVKSFAVNHGDMFYIQHNSDNFTIIDCNLVGDGNEIVLEEIKSLSTKKGITRFISTHPDEDHFHGIELLDHKINIVNFYVVQNNVFKSEETSSFVKYKELRDGPHHFYIYKNCKRKWMNDGDETRATAGLSVLWPDISNAHFIDALNATKEGLQTNNISCVIRYAIEGGPSFLWLGDLETSFMESIADEIDLSKTTVVFASHHGRYSGKIPDSWLKRLDPQIIVIGEAPSRHLHYYTGYNTLTQNTAGHITFVEIEGGKVNIYASNSNYSQENWLEYDFNYHSPNYVGTLTVETEYTL